VFSLVGEWAEGKSASSHFGGDEIMLVQTGQNRAEGEPKDFQKNLRKDSDFPAFRPANLTFLIKCEAG
jgi:hypothetical protein